MKKTKTDIQTEALAIIGDKQVSGVEIVMGVGKTLIGIKHMARNYTNIKKFLVVAPKKTIFESWEDDIDDFNFNYLRPHIDYSTYRSLTKHDFDYDCIYLDECHSLKASHNKWLYEYIQQGGVILGLTGTYPTTATSEKGKMCNYYTPLVYQYDIIQAIKDKILNNYEIYVHELELNKKPTIDKTGKHGDFQTSEMSDYTYWTGRIEDSTPGQERQMMHIQRMKHMQTFNTKVEYAKHLLGVQKKKTIIFANTKNQADELNIYSFHSGNPDSKKNLENFKNGVIKRLSAVEQLNEGVTIPKLKIGIILHSYANNRKAAQKIGRLLRLNPRETAKIHILCYADTVDKTWVTNALAQFDQTKIHWIKQQYFKNIHY